MAVPTPTRLDLAFVMDCTGSMGSYIEHARENIVKMGETIAKIMKIDARYALIEYRDHPQESRGEKTSDDETSSREEKFVTRVLPFTEHLFEVKKRLDTSTAQGGDDTPEAIADVLYDLLHLSWRQSAVKFCVMIADSPPHGLGCPGDAFDSGCPCNKDPMEIAHKLAEQRIIVYTVGCEPSITPYKEWFMALSHITSGQYISLGSSTPLTGAIISAAVEELSLSKLTRFVEEIVLTSGRSMSKDELVERVVEKLSTSQTKVTKTGSGQSLEQPTKHALEMAELKSLAEVRRIFKPLSTTERDPGDGASATVSAVEFKPVDSTLTTEQAARLATLVLSSTTGLARLLDSSATFERL